MWSNRPTCGRAGCPTNLALIETICRELAAGGEPIKFTTVAERARISRTTLYRDPELRAVIEEHRHRSRAGLHVVFIASPHLRSIS
jgi:hypothetical protein